MNRTFITNDCLAYFMYNKTREEYDSPLIGSLFEDDFQYVKFCRNFKKYIAMEPVFGEAKMPVTVMDYKSFPIMFLGDIEIHWPHESQGAGVLMEKFNRRLKRMKDPLFIWSDMQIYNRHHEAQRQMLIQGFKKVPGHVFVKKDDIEIHRDKSIGDRDKVDSHFSVPTWLDYNVMADHVLGRVHEYINFSDKKI